jgi:hypothetical protein
MKGYEEKYGLKPSPVETHILIKYIAKNKSFVNEEISNYYTKEREEELELEKMKASKINNIYTRNLEREIHSTTTKNSYFLEKARRMKELEIEEKDVLKKFEIDMPEWDLDEREKEIYELIKHDMIKTIKNYNKKKKLFLLYDKNKNNKIEWLTGIDDEINLLVKGIGRESNSSDREKFRLKLFLDEQLDDSEKTIIDEKDSNVAFGCKEEAIKMTKEKKMVFGISGFFLYRGIGNNHSNEGVERSLVIPLSGETKAGMLFFENGTYRSVNKFNYLNEIRLEILQKKLEPFFRTREN